MESQLRQVIEFLVQQQFYNAEDIIMDRTKEQSIHVKNSGQIINQFISILTVDLTSVIEGNYEKYLNTLYSHFKFDIKKVQRQFSERISFLNPKDRAAHLVVTFLVGEILGDIRDRVFKNHLEEIRTRLENNEKNKINFNEVITNAFERNEPNMALIYNLCFLQFIAQAVNKEDLEKTTNNLLEKYTDQFIDYIKG